MNLAIVLIPNDTPSIDDGCCGMTVARLAVFRRPLQTNYSNIQDSA
jgi:hypothetical protein